LGKWFKVWSYEIIPMIKFIVSIKGGVAKAVCSAAQRQ